MRALWLPIATLAACLLLGCEVVVPSDLPPIGCSGACPAGYQCVGSTCIPCTGPESCGSGVDSGSSEGGDATQDMAQGDVTLDTNPSPPDSADAPVDVPTVDVPVDANCGGALGCACAKDADCTSGICGDSTVLTSTFTSTNGPVCTSPCCTAGDCPAGFVCYGPGNAGNYCVASGAIGRPTPGTAGPGGACTSDGQCRSGKCNTAKGHCIDTCCSDANCAAPTVCSFWTTSPLLDGHAVFACIDTTGTVTAHQTCAMSPQCTSNDCEATTCRPHCCGTTSCAASGFHACELDLGTDSTNVCRFPSMDPTGTAFGGHCTAYDQCITRACDPSAMACTEFCCVDADCSAHPGYFCRPAKTSATRYLICQQ